MRYEFQIEINQEREILLKRIKNYFLFNGFKVNKSDDTSIEFKRGSLMLNKITFNPLKWKSQIKIILSKENIVTSIFEIDTKDQLVTNKEIALWESFIENYKKSIVFEDTFLERNQNELYKTMANSWLIIFKVILFTIVSLFLLFMIINRFD